MRKPLLLLALAGLWGCRGAFFLRDSEEQSFRVSCSSTECDRELESPSAPRAGPCASGLAPGFVLAGDALVLACHACVGPGRSEPVPERCRPLVCGRDADCPPHVGASSVHCLRGLCRPRGERPLSPVDVLALCMAGAGRSGVERPNALEDRRALAERACRGGVCVAPQGCHAP